MKHKEIQKMPIGDENERFHEAVAPILQPKDILNSPKEEPLNEEALNLDFEKERYEYCKLVYADIVERSKELENKARFLMGFAALFVGGVLTAFSNLNGIEKYAEYVNQINVPTIRWLIVWLNLFTVFSVILSFIGIFMVVKVRSYLAMFPEKFMERLFSEDSKYFKENTPAHLFRSFAIQVGLVVEINNELNYSKSKWIGFAWKSLIASLLFLVLMFGTLLFHFKILTI